MNFYLTLQHTYIFHFILHEHPRESCSETVQNASQRILTQQDQPRRWGRSCGRGRGGHVQVQVGGSQRAGAGAGAVAEVGTSRQISWRNAAWPL